MFSTPRTSESDSISRIRIIAGAMSGTSADGVDVAIVAITGRGIHMQADLRRHHHHPFGDTLRQRIISIRRAGTSSLAEMAQTTHDLTLAYAAAIAEARGDVSIDAIAAHGQTVYHAPPLTMQWFDPSLLAAKTKCLVVNDFRRADCAAGGQGAPLVPFADYILFRHPSRGRVLLNIGGIANLTYLPTGGSIDSLIAFDTGPGNCICDFLHPPFDLDGRISAGGKLIPAILARALSADYFHRPPPKSTDGPAMIALFPDDPTAPLADRLFTACQLSANTIANSIRDHCPAVDEIIVSGGGTENRTLMRLLSETTRLPLLTTDHFGVPSQAKEAMAFALLGAATLDGVPANVASCTGASSRVILGSITPSPSHEH
ncbi:MAG: anhydro-N-acetylmuramic acid kinase [Phycisphaerae bacterium]|nr:anhydro-N-acetylmuramic acid kinase [Phycisphaerae bacterium]